MTWPSVQCAATGYVSDLKASRLSRRPEKTYNIVDIDVLVNPNVNRNRLNEKLVSALDIERRVFLHRLQQDLHFD